LRGKPFSVRGAIAHTLEQRVVPQTVSVVAVGIPQGNLVEPLPQLLTAVMFHFARITLIWEQGRQPLTQPQAIIHLP
jgi:hypothetical protein